MLKTTRKLTINPVISEFSQKPSNNLFAPVSKIAEEQNTLAYMLFRSHFLPNQPQKRICSTNSFPFISSYLLARTVNNLSFQHGLSPSQPKSSIQQASHYRQLRKDAKRKPRNLIAASPKS